MLAVSPLRSANNEREDKMEGFSMEESEFPDFCAGNLLDSIDFDDLFDGDVLPDLEMDPEILAEISSVSGGEESEVNILSLSMEKLEDENSSRNHGNFASEDILCGSTIVGKKDESFGVKEGGKGSKSIAHSKNLPGKRKVKVDWTPELHRRFVQAVEQLGVDKAVPSRILELMQIDCLTRHNIASHLQKYRSHRKHLLAREAEAASWSQRRQMYGAATTGGGGRVAGKRDHMKPWITPTMGFPHVTPMPHFRPLHVWGHPSVDQSMMNMWPKYRTPPPLQHAWSPTQPPQLPPPPIDNSFWISHHHHVPTQGTPCFQSHLPSARFPTPLVPGISPLGMYKVEQSGQTLPQPPSDTHPSKESVDAAIEDVLSKPWLPLPLGLKPPSVNSVIVELQRQGISKVPPICA